MIEALLCLFHEFHVDDLVRGFFHSHEGPAESSPVFINQTEFDAGHHFVVPLVIVAPLNECTVLDVHVAEVALSKQMDFRLRRRIFNHFLLFQFKLFSLWNPALKLISCFFKSGLSVEEPKSIKDSLEQALLSDSEDSFDHYFFFLVEFLSSCRIAPVFPSLELHLG